MMLRVFPRRTKATPDDEMVRIGHIGLFTPECAEVHVSVTFEWDLQEAETIADEYRQRGFVVKVGGPAIDDPGGTFSPGMYLKKGYVITSRGCPNRCWFCKVWKREGDIRELPITEGWDVLDSNLLACSEKHIMAVFGMLMQQPKRPKFTGGLDPARITPEIAHELKRLKPERIYTAYDTPDDLENLISAGAYLLKAGFTEASHTLMCYVLIGYPRDTFDDAEKRLKETMDAGFTPMAMLYRAADERPDYRWRQFQRKWARPTIIYAEEQQ